MTMAQFKMAVRVMSLIASLILAVIQMYESGTALNKIRLGRAA